MLWKAENVKGVSTVLTELWDASSGPRASATAAFAHFGTLLQQQAESFEKNRDKLDKMQS